MSGAPAAALLAGAVLLGPLAVAGDSPGDGRPRPSRSAPGMVREITPQVRVAIDRGLAYLVQNQKDDGSFSGQEGYPVAVDGLAGLAFLSGGYTDKEGPYTTAMARGIANLLQFQRADGYFDDGMSRMYGHGFATLFLAELYGMTGDLSQTIRGALTGAVRLIEESQCEDGGWDYQPEGGRGSDTSITVCQTMALRAARNLGITVKGTVVERARAYIRKAQNPDGGFKYRISGTSLLGDVSTFPRSAAGVCILYSLAKKGDEYSSREIKNGFDYLLQNYRSSSQFIFYGDYYCAQAMFQAGEKYWAEYYPYLREKLVTHQRSDGSWTGIGVEVTPQATAMALIALQVPFRLLPIIER